MRPQISVIVPVYNVSMYLEKCVESLLAQTFADFELILVDDGSSDESGGICDSYEEKDSRVQAIHQRNAGVSAARNRGLARARGTYIAFVDADDWAAPEMLENLLHEITWNETDMAICRFYEVTDGKKEIHNDHFPWGVYEGEKIMPMFRQMFGGREMMGSICRCMFKAGIIRRVGISFSPLRFSEDLLFVLEYLLCCQRVCYMEKPLYFYNRSNPVSTLTTIGEKNTQDFLAIPGKLYRLFKKYGKLTTEILEGLGEEYFLCVQRVYRIAYEEQVRGENGYKIFTRLLDTFELREDLSWDVIRRFSRKRQLTGALLKLRWYWVFWYRLGKG